ncbi:hypothetical protein B0H14DRAFT_3443429 [Mycena olivaceomarginata]|nr:hypothetical protein B0H14DRAFT_3443429 [Mycena olivaceomarginata]
MPHLSSPLTWPARPVRRHVAGFPSRLSFSSVRLAFILIHLRVALARVLRYHLRAAPLVSQSSLYDSRPFRPRHSLPPDWLTLAIPPFGSLLRRRSLSPASRYSGCLRPTFTPAASVPDTPLAQTHPRPDSLRPILAMHAPCTHGTLKPFLVCRMEIAVCTSPSRPTAHIPFLPPPPLPLSASIPKRRRAASPVRGDDIEICDLICEDFNIVVAIPLPPPLRAPLPQTSTGRGASFDASTACASPHARRCVLGRFPTFPTCPDILYSLNRHNRGEAHQ